MLVVLKPFGCAANANELVETGLMRKLLTCSLP